MTTAIATPVHRPADLSRYRGAHDAMRRSNELLVAGLVERPTARRAGALARWFAGYADELRAHHSVEDDTVFPALDDRVAAYAPHHHTISADHHRVDELLEQIGDGLSRLATGTDARPDDAHAAALSGAVELCDLLAGHLDLEDLDILPLIERHFSYEEYAEIDEEAIKRLSLRQLRFTVPWFMAMLPEDVAAAGLADAPLALRVIWRLSRRSYARLVRDAFEGCAPAPR